MVAGSAPPAVIARGITVTGDLVGEGDIVVEGRVDGRVGLRSELTITESGAVEADIEARSVVVRGRVRGRVVAEDKVHLGRTAVVDGDISARTVIIEDGAVYRGRIDMAVELPDGVSR